MTDPGPRAVVVDTSAAVAIILAEPGNGELLACLGAAAVRVMSAATHVELGIVIEARSGPLGADVVTRFMRDAGIEIVDVDAEIADRAVGAWRRYGKGRHPAALNYGDCFVYALAERTGYPVLCTGRDFSATDLDVLPSAPELPRPR